MLPLVEAVEDAERLAALLLAANPANAHVEHQVGLLQAGEHQSLPISHLVFWWVACDRRECGCSRIWAARTLLKRCEDVAISPKCERCSPRLGGPDMLGPVLALSSL